MKQEQRMTIDFEKDQEEVLDKTTNINKLADKIKEMQVVLPVPISIKYANVSLCQDFSNATSWCAYGLVLNL